MPIMYSAIRVWWFIFLFPETHNRYSVFCFEIPKNEIDLYPLESTRFTVFPSISSFSSICIFPSHVLFFFKASLPAWFSLSFSYLFSSKKKREKRKTKLTSQTKKDGPTVGWDHVVQYHMVPCFLWVPGFHSRRENIIFTTHIKRAVDTFTFATKNR